MNPNDITALVLTFNEACNLERTLSQLQWLDRIVLVDSGSTDETLDIAARFANTCVVTRNFDNFAAQRNFGLSQLSTPWVLSLDADHCVSADLAREIGGLPNIQNVAYYAPFEYMVWGKALRCSILPPRPVLFSAAHCHYVEDGHAERLVIDGASGRLAGVVQHDDRKPLSRWLGAQDRYAVQEAAKLRQQQLPLGLADRIRQWNWLAPIAVFIYVLIFRGGILDGRRGLFYAHQRMLAECLLALRRLEEDDPNASGPV